MHKIKPDSIHSICLNCCGRVGDLLIRTPLIEALAKICPQASITVIVDPQRESLIENHPNIHHVIIYNRKKRAFLKYITGLVHFVWSLRKSKYDLFIDTYCGSSSRKIAKFSGAKFTIGFFKKEKDKRYYTHSIFGPELKNSWSKDFGELLKPLGYSKADVRAGTTFIPTEDGYKNAEQILGEDKTPWVTFFIGAYDKKKIWPVENFVDLANLIIKDYGYHIGVFVPLGQEYLTDEFARLCTQKQIEKIKIISAFDFSTAGAIIKKSKYFISNDTGFLHIAFGVKTPAIALFTYTHPDCITPEDTIMIPCFKPDAILRDEFMRPRGTKDITVSEVFSAVNKMETYLT